MRRQPVELRSWALITISFVLGMAVAEFVDIQAQSKADRPATSVASSDAAPLQP